MRLENQGGYKQTIDKYTQSSQDSRPDMVMLPEYTVQQMADSDSAIPVGACMEASEFDTSAFLDRALLTLPDRGRAVVAAVQRQRPRALLQQDRVRQRRPRPGVSPVSLEELRTTSQALVDARAEGVGMAFDSGVDSGGGWFIEQWFARAGEPYADNDNGRSAPATQVLYAGPLGVALLTEVQSLINDGLAVTVGDNPGGQDALLKLADPAAPAAMAIATSAAIGTVKTVLDGGLIPGITSDRARRRPDARPRRRALGDRRRGLAVHRRREGRRPRGRGVGLHAVPHDRPVAVDVGGAHRLRAGARGRPGARPDQDDVRDRPPLQGRLRRRSRPAATARRRSGRCSARCSRCAR